MTYVQGAAACHPRTSGPVTCACLGTRPDLEVGRRLERSLGLRVKSGLGRMSFWSVDLSLTRLPDRAGSQ